MASSNWYSGESGRFSIFSLVTKKKKSKITEKLRVKTQFWRNIALFLRNFGTNIYKNSRYTSIAYKTFCYNMGKKFFPKNYLSILDGSVYKRQKLFTSRL